MKQNKKWSMRIASFCLAGACILDTFARQNASELAFALSLHYLCRKLEDDGSQKGKLSPHRGA